MIRVNLNVLLAERNMTASQLSNNTGISKTTLSSLVNNTSGGIQYDTIDKICLALGIGPNDFFDYIPYNYTMNLENLSTVQMDIKLNENDNYIINKIVQTMLLEISVTGRNIERVFDFEVDFMSENEERTMYVIKFKNENLSNKNNELKLKYEHEKIEFFNGFYHNISYGHQQLFKETMESLIIDQVVNEFKEYAHNNNVDNSVVTEYIEKNFGKDKINYRVPWD